MIDSHTLKTGKFYYEQEYLGGKGFEVVIAKCNTPEEIIDIAKDADCIGVNRTKVGKDIISSLDKCKAIIRYGVGYDAVDLDSASEEGIFVCNIPDYCMDEVATHAMALILDLCRKTTFFDRHVRTGQWDHNYGYKMHRLSELTLGLIGFGNISRRLSQFAKSFGFNIISSDPFINKSVFEEYDVEKVTIDEIYKQSDIISLHVPLNESTKHIISKESISKMKDNVMIINTSRGPLINKKDLIIGLESGKIKAVGLDVVEGEPIRDKDDDLYKFDNVVITPHCGFNSYEATIDQHLKVAYTAEKIFNGKIPENVVNRRQIESITNKDLSIRN